MPGYKRPPDGYVSLGRIAQRLGVDRRVLKGLYEFGRIPGVRDGGVICLERRSLAAYLWSQPRCVRDGCGRRVIGDGPGCDRHRRSGRHHSDETRQKMSETQGGIGPVEKVCERCGKPFVGRGKQFCSKSCATTAANAQRGSEHLRGLHEAHGDYRALVERVKAERDLLDVDELVDRYEIKRGKKRLRSGLLRTAGVPRTAAAISGHIRDGRLQPERDLGFDKPELFTRTEIDRYITWLRDVHQRDGRLSRWNATTPEQAKMRGALSLAVTRSTAESGRLASAINKTGRPPVELGELTEGNIRRLRADGTSLREIERLLRGDASLMQIRRVLGV